MSARSLISAIGVYAPPTQQPVRERERGCRTNMRIPIERITGIKSVHTASPGEFAIDMAEKAALNCLASAGLPATEIDLLISCSISRYDCPENGYVFEPSTGLRLRTRLGLPSALAFDISNACAGLFTGLLVADSFIRSGRARHALVVSGEYISSISECAMKEISSLFDTKLACLTLGDGAAAVILSASSGQLHGLQDMALYSVPEHSDLCVAKFTTELHGGAIMSTRSAELSRVMSEELSAHIPSFLARQRGTKVDWVIPHQTSKKSIREASQSVNAKMGWDLCNSDSVILSLETYGNTATTSHMLALHEGILSGRIKDGDTVLFSINASGLNVGSFLYKFDDLPSRLKRGEVATADNAVNAPRIKTRARIAGEAFHFIDSSGGSPCRCYRPVIEESLKAAKIRAKDVDLLIYSGVYRCNYLVEPSMASQIAKCCRFGDGAKHQEHFLCFDLLAGPGGVLHAMTVASGMMAVLQKRCAVVVSGDADPNLDCPHAIPMGFGGSAAAIVLRTDFESDCHFGSLHVSGDYDSAEGLVRFTQQSHGETFMSSSGRSKSPRESEEVIVEVVRAALAAASRDGNPPDLFLVPSPRENYVDILWRRFQVPAVRIISGPSGTGAFSADLVAALVSARLQPGQTCLFLGYSDVGEAVALCYSAGTSAAS